MEQVAEAPVQQAETPVTGQSTEGQPQEAQTTEQKPANEVTQETKVETEEKHPSRAYRRMDRWRQRAIEAEAVLKAEREFRQVQSKPAETPVSDEPKREQFGTYEEFIEARATFKAEKAADDRVNKRLDEHQKKTEQQRTKGEQEKFSKAWNAQIEKARDQIDDFDEVTAESEAPITAPMAGAIQESDKGALIAYHLAKNSKEAERISKLSPSKQVAAIVALEDKVAQPAKTPSKAPEPITPVGTKVEVEKDPSKMSQSEFNAWRRKSLARK